ncbi:MAG: AraC family transcriptional regulator [Deltaproteobacteria bacterium]|nr:AraC family transcriptional regulator [Deltaproteobacteria bacterium]
MNLQGLAPEHPAGEPEAIPAVLAQRIARWTEGVNRYDTAISSLSLHRWETPTEPHAAILEQSICLIAQGAKRVMLGEETYHYDPNTFLLTSLGLPVVANVTRASPAEPYLGLTLQLDQRALAQLLVDSNLPLPRTRPTRRGMAVGEVTGPLLSAFQRLLDLLERPEDIPILAPLVQREIMYYLLVSELGPRLRQTAAAGSQGHQVARAIDWLKTNFNLRLRVDDLASRVGMSPSTFHHHFRALTAMSPLQFQKRLRLNEARRLMLTERLDAATAAFQVGYESPSQFSREYSRMFGSPPLRDIQNLRQVSVGLPG